MHVPGSTATRYRDATGCPRYLGRPGGLRVSTRRRTTIRTTIRATQAGSRSTAVVHFQSRIVAGELLCACLPGKCSYVQFRRVEIEVCPPEYLAYRPVSL